ncbi:MAG: thiamine pyrophosphate-dependent dehydrogenase E1 component subunit alpha, partial [Pseudomonadota bacterium]
FYRNLYLIRRAEEEIERHYPSDVIKSPVHLSIGQEHIAVGVCSALAKDDVVFSNYRGHAHYLARGGNLKAFWAELYGKQGGFARGRAGSMHLMDIDCGFMQASAVVATGIPNATGYALALKMKQKKSIVVCFHGEGAVDEGVWHESLNFAALHHLPILYICENNEYAIYSHQKARAKQSNIARLATMLGLKATRMETGDCHAIFNETKSAINILLQQNGPVLLEIPTMRWRDHVGIGSDIKWGYRDAEALNQNIKNDHIAQIGARLKPAVKMKIEHEINQQIDDAIEYASQSPFPDQSELYSNVTANANSN